MITRARLTDPSFKEISARGDHCPYPLPPDGHPHTVIDGICVTCGAHIRPIRIPSLGGMFRENHYPCRPRRTS